MRGKQILAGLLTIAMLGSSMAVPATSIQAEAAGGSLKKITISKKATVYAGAKKKLKVTKAPKAAKATVKWSSSDKKIARVNKNGVVTGVKAGTATITATAGSGKNRKTASCKVTVKKAVRVRKVSITAPTRNLTAGDQVKLKATVKPKKATTKKLQYSSSNKEVATVSSKGLITAKSAGTAKITAKATDGSGKKASLTILVAAKPAASKPNTAKPEVKVSELKAESLEITLNAGETRDLKISVSPADATNKKLEYTSSDEDAVSVSQEGVITAKAQGSSVITAKAADGSQKQLQIKVTVTNKEKVRTIVTSDAEADDQNSFMRLMLYANEMDLEGVVFTSSMFHWAGDPDMGVEMHSWAGTEWAKGLLDDYAKIYENLKVHADGYPTPNYLRSIIKEGNIKFKGDMSGETEGSRLIKEALLDDDERTLYLQAWGGSNTIAMALKSIKDEYYNENETDDSKKAEWNAIQEKVSKKACLYLIGEQDETYEYISTEWPDICTILDGGKDGGIGGIFWEFAYPWVARTAEPELTGTFNGDWMFGNIKNGHGALLANYHLASDDGFLSEGDSPAYFYLLDTGLRNLEDPTYGGWSGRFAKVSDSLYIANGRAFDFNPYQRNAGTDELGGMSSAYTFARWFDDIQNDFAARADWCVMSDYSKANHRPTVTVREGINLTAAPGDSITLHAEATDPDGDKLSYSWWQYYEADTYNGELDGKLSVSGSAGHIAQFEIPTDAKVGDTIHMVIKVKDNKENYMTHYQRVIITVTAADAIESVGITGTGNSIEVGQSINLRAEVLPQTAKNRSVKWSSSDESVATVDASGRVTGVKAGQATITAVAKANANMKATYEVTVTKTYESANTGKVRTIVTTDGEVDDMDSFMRLMLYSNEMDLAGLILTSSKYHYAGDPDQGIEPYRWTGTAWAGEVLDDYEEVYENLKVHADGYPEPDYLRSILKIGNIKNQGEMEEITEGSEFMKEILLDDDDRTLYIQTWGGTNTTARALKSIEEEYKGTDQWDAIQQKIYDKAVIYIILNQDVTYSEYIAKAWPGIKVINDGGNFWRFAYMWKRVPEQLTTKLQGNWMYNNIKTGHGPLLENYKLMGDGTILEGELDNEQRGSEEYLLRNPQYGRYDFISEGDSPSFFYLLDTGLRSLEDPTYGGWGGRFGREEDGTYKNTVSDFDPFGQKEDTSYTLTRWFDDIQSDFAARADWCVASDYSSANHRPTVAVKEGIDLSAAPGERLKLHATAQDPDGDVLSYGWWQYYEADTYDGDQDGTISITGADTDTISFVIPEDAKEGDTIHMIIQVKDNRENYMTHYQRVIITVQES